MVTIPSHVRPDSVEEKARWDEQGLRLRLLEGAHIQDVQEDIRSMFASEIAADLEISADVSRNVFLHVYNQLNTAYSTSPEVRVSEESGEVDLSPVLTPRLWPQQAQTGLIVHALNEAVVRVDWAYWNESTSECSYRLVTPDTVVLKADPSQPDSPLRVEEVRPRSTPAGDTVWTWEVWDISDPENPIFRVDAVNDNGDRQDATHIFAPELVGKYPYMHEGLPVLPYVLYHKAIGSRLWSWQKGIELVRGSLRLASLWTHWGDGFTNAAYPQRYSLDVESQAGISRNIGGVSVDVVPTDRKSILKFSSTGPTGGVLSQFSAAMDPRSAAESLKIYESGLSTYAGLNPSDLQVTGAQSGYAIVVSREGQRRKQREIEPALRIADQTLLATAAKLSNAYGGHNLPTNPRDYSINYRGIGEGPEERKAKAEGIERELEMRLISRIDGIRRLNPEIVSDSDAVERLLAVDRIDEVMAEAARSGEEAQAVPGGGVPSGTEKAQDTALNGAQVTSAQSIVLSVAAGELPRDAGVSMLSNFFNLPPSVADQIMGSVGRSFRTSTPE